MPIICPICGKESQSGSATRVGKKCAICLQTEKLQEIAKREEMRNRLDRERQERERSQEQSRRHFDKLQDDRVRREQENADRRRRNDEVVRQYEELEDDETAPEDSGDDNSHASQTCVSQQSYYEEPKKRSCLGCLFKLVILAVVGFFALAALGYFLDKGENKKSEKTPTESKSANTTSSNDTQNAEIKNAASPDQKISPRSPGASTSPGKSVIEDVQAANPFEGQNFPLYVMVTDEVKLLNNEGKEIIIPKGSTLRIDSRSSKGTLTISLDKRLFVGNESRLLGKVKIR